MKIIFLFFALALVLGCEGGGQDFPANPPLTIGGDERPAEVAIPSDYDPSISYPLLIVLHGFGASGRIQTAYFQLFDLVDTKQFVLVFPDGTMNDGGDRFWNATEACCDPTDSVDDVGYLSALIEEAERAYHIDRKRVYLMGHSNGGFMSFRMACAASERITAIVSLAGATYEDPADCQPASSPVSVLAVHGTDDTTIEYAGGATDLNGSPTPYPGAVESVERFAARAGCDTSSPSAEGSVDLVPSIDGAETEEVAYMTGCDAGVDAGLWTIHGAGHIPPFSSDFADLATDWLFRHSR